MATNATQYLLDFPKINALVDLSDALHLSDYTLYHLVNNSESFYKEIIKKKKNGKIRVLACPSKKLKVVQAWILREILEKLSISDAATAFRQGRNIHNNVEIHKNNKFHLCMDMEDFFGTIPAKWIYTIFHAIGYNENVSSLFTSICTYKGFLPQGGVTSPILSNLVCRRLDRRILGYTGARNISYSRYADDITLSCNNPDKLMSAYPFVRFIIENEGFKLNKDKFRVIRPGSRRRITGLTITDKNEIGVGSQVKRELRAKIHRLVFKTHTDEERNSLVNHISGWLAFLSCVDPIRAEYLKNYWSTLKINHDIILANTQVAVTKE